MSQEELTLFNSLSRTEQLQYLRSAKEAIDKTNQLFKTLKERYNGKGDAFRHAYWNALSSKRIGSGITEALTRKHENQSPSYAFSHKETKMDLFNNRVGRQIADQGSKNLVQDVLNALSNGQLRYITHQANSGRATFKSKVVPTNE